ncbi:hypothetical protein A1D18_05815 [Candidatus Rickettsiella isopodorum]|jgi:hypothetical protein|uniref:Uncharacterized protein n=1 Tax=Candidatus Rickettsiella isopodorum TaxID=1225476 RepID=A0A1J8P5V6_9COXI|nr:hypothetical protein A1D18_05815 [Candidatus Rickettsiella isopodorum]
MHFEEVLLNFIFVYIIDIKATELVHHIQEEFKKDSPDFFILKDGVGLFQPCDRIYCSRTTKKSPFKVRRLLS